jgi:hypothetical protein
MSCTGPCEQGRHPCPCPEQCELAEPDLPLTGGDVGIAIGIVLACVCFVVAGPATIDFVRSLL